MELAIAHQSITEFTLLRKSVCLMRFRFGRRAVPRFSTGQRSMAVSPGRVRRVCAKRRQGRRSEIEAEARKSGSVVTSVSVGGATAYIASGEIEVPPSALVS